MTTSFVRQSSRRDYPSIESLQCQYLFRTAELADLESIETLAQKHRFGIGLANLKLCYQESPDLWFVIEDLESGNIVAYLGKQQMSNGCIHGLKVFTAPEVRNKAITRLLLHQGDTSGNATAVNFARFNTFAMAISFKLNVYAGVPVKRSLNMDTTSSTSDMVKKIDLVPVTKLNLSEVIAYDRNILPDVDRSRFMSEWICPVAFPTPVHAVAACLNNKVVGYGVLRSGWLETTASKPTSNQTISHWFLSPVYADSNAIALLIINHLMVNFLEPGIEINYECLATNRFMQQVAHELQIEHKVCEYHRHPTSVKYFTTRERICKDRVYAGILEWPL